jgi:hypothetical protein
MRAAGHGGCLFRATVGGIIPSLEKRRKTGRHPAAAARAPIRPQPRPAGHGSMLLVSGRVARRRRPILSCRAKGGTTGSSPAMKPRAASRDKGVQRVPCAWASAARSGRA